MLSCREICENGHFTVPETRYVIMLHRSHKPFPCKMYCNLLSDFPAVSIGECSSLRNETRDYSATDHRTGAGSLKKRRA